MSSIASIILKKKALEKENNQKQKIKVYQSVRRKNVYTRIEVGGNDDGRRRLAYQHPQKEEYHENYKTLRSANFQSA